MKSTPSIPSFQLSTEEWYTQSGTQAMLFAVLQGFVSSTNVMAGYLEEEEHLGINTKVHKQLVRTSQSQLKNVHLLDQLYRLTAVKNIHIQNIHIEQLIKKVSSISNIQISSQSTYTSSLVGIDDEAFCQSALAILLTCGPSRVFTTESRRRGKHLVIAIFAKNNQWVPLSVHNAIRNFKTQANINKKYQLDELLVTYALSVLYSLGVAVSSRIQNKQDRIYMHLPVTQQLNVFDTNLLTE